MCAKETHLACRSKVVGRIGGHGLCQARGEFGHQLDVNSRSLVGAISRLRGRKKPQAGVVVAFRSGRVGRARQPERVERPRADGRAARKSCFTSTSIRICKDGALPQTALTTLSPPELRGLGGRKRGSLPRSPLPLRSPFFSIAPADILVSTRELTPGCCWLCLDYGVSCLISKRQGARRHFRQATAILQGPPSTLTMLRMQCWVSVVGRARY